MLLTVLLLIVILMIALLADSIQIIKQQTIGIVERLGKFHKSMPPGLNFKLPIIDRVVSRVSLRINQLDVVVESKTKDNVFVVIPCAVQYMVPESNVVDAYYRLSSPINQIRAYVSDSIRSSLSKLELDAAFEAKDDIAKEIDKSLSNNMRGYGYQIINSLITDIAPDEEVKRSMNKINAAQREREAAKNIAEAEKITIVKAAEAQAEAKELQGKGIALQRKAIADGLAAQINTLKNVGVNATETLLLMTQYFDALADISKNSKTSTILLPSNPAGVGNFADEIRNTIFSLNTIKKINPDTDTENKQNIS